MRNQLERQKVVGLTSAYNIVRLPVHFINVDALENYWSIENAWFTFKRTRDQIHAWRKKRDADVVKS